jgi:hypothetical protein
MCMRERLSGNLLWMPSMVVRGMDGALLIPLGLIEWGYGRIQGRGGVYFVVIPDLCLKMGP